MTRFPPGWDEARVRRVLEHYAAHSDEEAVAEDETTYELCATFSLERDSDVKVFWNHASGRQCFTVDALDPP